ncbi:hypothetical protein [Mesorhizobium sp. B2-1-3A]|uniref:hypothetical protein n=1 Tax=Mesorhizobium sp. B2-1-3A TaxID=2589971 RepID=UPI00112BADDC|nr:hypothetical protein [Mesorhizobium sp. B2-1-3A]TPM89860.1 hypothetical protein FJ977_35375 [Mesorhizobium sp. B2-1-3A]
MPYKPTGRPNGRPRKNPLPIAADAKPVLAAEATPSAAPRPVSRARKMFRQAAEALNPSPFVVLYDNRGRPRHRPRHTSLKV